MKNNNELLRDFLRESLLTAEKIRRLSSFFTASDYRSLPERMRKLLRRQRGALRSYRDALLASAAFLWDGGAVYVPSEEARAAANAADTPRRTPEEEEVHEWIMRNIVNRR